MEIEVFNCHLFLKLSILYFRLSILLPTQKEKKTFDSLFDLGKAKNKNQNRAYMKHPDIKEGNILIV